MKRVLKTIENAAASTVLARNSLKTRITLATLAIFLASLWSLSYYASRMLREDMERMLGEQQHSTVSLIATQINRALAERLDALRIAASVAAAPMQRGPAAIQTFVEQRTFLHSLFGSGVFVATVDGTIIADYPIPSGRLGLNVIDRDYFTGAFGEGKATIGRPVVGKFTRTPIIVMATPIRDARGTVIGALCGAINLGVPNFLDEITESRYGKTGGYLINAPLHRLVVTATDKRRVMETLPAPGIEPSVDRLIDGFDGSAVMTDPLGVEMLVSAAAIPVADWQMVALLPAAEAFEPIWSMQRRMLLATLLLTLIAGAVTWWVLRRQLSPLFDAASALANAPDDGPPPPVPVARPDEIGLLISAFNRLLRSLGERKTALRESEERLQTLIRTLPDLIWLKNSEGVFLACNHRFEQYFGASEKDIVGKTDYDFVSKELADSFRRQDRVAITTGGTSVNEEWITFADGHRELLETTKTPMFGAQGQLIGVLGIGHDITERRLAEQDQRIAAIAFESQEGMFITDAGHTIMRVNQAFSRITGYSAGEAVGRTPNLLRSRRHEGAFYAEMAEGIRNSGTWQGETWNRRKNGEEHPAWTTITAVKDSAGETTHYVVTMVDITARKRADEALRKLSQAVEQSPVSIVITDLEGRIEYVNPAFSLTSGYSAAEAVGQNPRLLKSGRTSEAIYAGLWAALVAGKAWRGEFVNRRKDGTEYIEAATIGPVRQPDGTVTHYLAVKEDITEQVRILADLRLSEERLRLAKNAAGLGIFDWDIVNGKGEWDARARELQGLRPDEPITSATLISGIAPDDLAGVRANIDRAFDPRGSGEYRSEARIVSRVDGSVRQVAASGQVFFDEGRPVRIVGTLKDVTQQRRLEREIKERRNEMDSLVNQQVAAHTAAAIAHELNQPLVAVAAYSEAALRILRGGIKSPERLARALKGAEEQAQRAGRTLHELLSFLHKGETRAAPVGLAGVVRDALAIVEESDSGAFQVQLDLEPGLPPVLGDRLQLQKVLVNLLHNGVEAMRNAGTPAPTVTIKARTAADGKMAHVTVHDSGPGLDRETAHRVFDSFFTTKPEGIGLGLAISRALIEAQGGRLWADAEAGPGATFHFILPFAADRSRGAADQDERKRTGPAFSG